MVGGTARRFGGAGFGGRAVFVFLLDTYDRCCDFCLEEHELQEERMTISEVQTNVAKESRCVIVGHSEMIARTRRRRCEAGVVAVGGWHWHDARSSASWAPTLPNLRCNYSVQTNS